MRYLITGANGFIGSHLTRRLVGLGESICAWTGLSGDLSRLREVQDRVEVQSLDLCSVVDVTKAIEVVNPGVIFHCAAAGMTDPFLPLDEAIRTNVYGTINLVRAVQGRARVVVLRTAGELDALNVYAASKAAAWQFCRMYARTQAWPLVGAMLFQVYGPGQSTKNVVPAAIEAALAGKDFPMSSGRVRRDWIYIDDVIDALLALVQADRFDVESIEIGLGGLLSVRDVVAKIYSMVGRGGRPLLGLLPDRPGDIDMQHSDVEVTKLILNWEPRVTIDAGLRRTIDSMQAAQSA